MIQPVPNKTYVFFHCKQEIQCLGPKNGEKDVWLFIYTKSVFNLSKPLDMTLQHFNKLINQNSLHPCDTSM